MHRHAGLFLLLVNLAAAAFDPAAFKAAVDLYNDHHPREAQKAFEVLAAANPANADIQFYLGRLALQRDDIPTAVTALERAVELHPADARFHLRLGDAYGLSAQRAGLFSQLGFARKCRMEYEKAVGLDPQNIDARWALMEFSRQAPGIVGGGLDKAMEQAQAIKQLDDKRGRLALAGVYAQDGRFEPALAEFEELLKNDPQDYSANYQFGRVVAMSGLRLDDGLAALRKCLDQRAPEGQPPLAAVHWRMGNILERKGDQAGARTAYETALKVDPNFQQATTALKKLPGG